MFLNIVWSDFKINLQHKVNGVRIVKILLTILVLLLIDGCANTFTNHVIHNDITDRRFSEVLNKTLLLPTRIKVYVDISENVSELVPKITTKTNLTIKNSILGYLNSNLDLKTAYYSRPNMTDTLRKYDVLINQLISSVYKHTNPNSWDYWPHKYKQFDYSIGDELAFLKNKNIDAVMMVKGAQHNKVFKGSLVFGTLYLIVCIIDVNSGDLLWVDYSEHPDFDMNQTGVVNKMLSSVFDTFPKQILAKSNE